MKPSFLCAAICRRSASVIHTLWLSLVFIWAAVFSVSLQAAEPDATQPNIIFILADDLGYGDVGCYGQELIQTPHIDSLAAEGLKFTQAYAGSSVCAPSRCTLMTGKHNGHGVARDNIPHYHTYLEEEDVTVAELLKQAGYRCGGVGKWSLGDPGTVGRATNQGFDMWLGYLNQDHAHYYYPEYLDDGEGRMELPDNSRTHEHYSHHLLTDRALAFIRESAGKEDGKPFFLYAPYTLPHFSAPSEDKTHLAIPSDAPYTDKPWSQKEKNYAAMVTLLDQDVGRLVALVDELGLKENTLIIFTSDNGPWGGAGAERFQSSGPLRGVKSNVYEGGIRVPFIARWPGTAPAGRESDAVIAFWDVLPTLTELAGVDAASKMPEGQALDGLSFASVLTGGEMETPHEFLYWDYGHCRRRYDQAVRLGDWKGVRLGADSAIELYNLRTDLGETTGVAAAHPDVVKRIAHIMETAPVPNERYSVGELYRGSQIWKPEDHGFKTK